MWTRSVILSWILFIFIFRSVLCQELPKLNPLSLPESLSINSRARLLCVASSGDQPIDFQWLKNGVLLSAGKIEQLDEWTSSLTINPLSLEHIGNYTCKASNSIGTNYVTAPLFVTAPPQWIIEPTDLQIRAGKSAVLHCSAEGSPKVKVSWKRKSAESHQNLLPVLSGDNYHVYDNGSLLISNAQKSKSGTYVCEASNGIEGGLQKNIELIVFESPSVDRIVDHVTVERGQTAYFSCLARGDPPLSFEWMKDHSSLSDRPGVSERISFSELASIENTQFTITVVNTKPTDEGLYSCIARNEYGSDEKDVRLMLVERPQPPQVVELVDIWSRSVRIRWSAPDNGNSPILNYTVEYWTNPGGHWNITVSSSSSSAIMRGLKPFTTYNFHVWASNSVGNSDPSQQSHFRTAKEEPSATPVDVRVEDKGSKFVRLSWKPPPREDWNGDLAGYYVGYKRAAASRREPYTFNTVEVEETNSYYYMLRGLRRGTAYLVTVRAFNEVGSGPPSEAISFMTHDKESLPLPKLLMGGIGSTFIRVTWDTVDEFKSSISSYTLHYRKNGDKWNEITIPDAFQNSYTLTNLEPGVSFQIYLMPHSYSGIGEPSEIATVRTSPEAIFQPTPPSSQVQHAVDDVTQILYIVIPVAVATVIIVIVIVAACVYVYSKRPLPASHTYGDLPASKNFSYMHTAPRQRDIPITISGNNVMRYGSPYSTVPLTRPEQDDDEPIYESVVGDTLRKIKERSFDDDFKISNATIV